MRGARLAMALGSLTVALVGGGVASASPVPVQITGVSANIFVVYDGNAIGGTPSGSPLTVVGSSLTFDPAVPRVDDFNILLQGGASSQITLSQSVDIGFGPVNEIVVNSASLFSNPLNSYPALDLGDGLSFQFNNDPNGTPPAAGVVSSLVLSNNGSGTTVVDPFFFSVTSLSGTLFFSGFAPGDSLDMGIVFPIAEFLDVGGKLLQVKADVLITGTVVPEPDAALLMGLAVLCIGMRVRSEGVKRRLAA